MYKWEIWIRNIFHTEQKRSIFLTALILLVFLPLAKVFEGFWRLFFCLPSAQMCSLFLGADCITTENGYMLTNRILAVHVTKACSAAGFFILLSALMVGVVIKSARLSQLMKIVWILPLAYIITILANSARILGGWVTGKWARRVLPENFWPGVHLGTGIVVFLTFLILTYLLLTWRSYNEYQGNETSHSG
jgi:exosortase K